MKTKSHPETVVKEIMSERNKLAEKKIYEKPELKVINLLDESARGWSEPPPPGDLSKPPPPPGDINEYYGND